ncbi:MAG: tRNA (adenosine(37)-N6)-dimethylallyltransferase MiaA [Thiobacillus sp.]|uniref:tRNA (adenosine(37)-N6)-dimethylallyltransferase MiaA n=2 Tax=Thiobacillus TaxID=919 RepID=UPI00086CA882|nr:MULTISPECIES: tRNA (adenosine(37)-N6)-dimethylallyltransferase MiaA [unclassified Thiobacillus]MBN8770648.1 tRNA (adenosine(37)-N6)-dimethylallyltransferase MiaA [Thiobacillus sp.]MBN8780582.1 tRNA (adenosine(37)-N6)-dimethylallyltransferase MiaA [Thiobacillus sp.]ODV01686.1 MAG: tRNA (adenosine(37)-N6)-dimethylallyltransferase MiaA [Thiobacillus sp. SCN 63-57]OJY57752.1 MAG: tRNA (adenosine(37)-N6)-dimethylallyltransferase MiaA [Thiobacillus sp. 0-1251]
MPASSPPPAIFLMGPTASGKTALAVSLVERFPLEIISVDSALVYRGMDIGTAKPDAATLARAPHHLLDIRDPTETYSAAAFCDDARRLMADIAARGMVPLLVGGTMLYFRALLQGLDDLPRADAALRKELEAEAAARGWPALHAELAVVDPATAARLAPNDSQRIGRALEVFRLSGTPMSALLDRVQSELPYRVLQLALIPSDRAVLHQRIAARFDAMLAEGLIDEVDTLRRRYALNADLPSMRAVGYRQAWAYLDGEIDLKDLREQGIAATRQLAKRQLTWLRSWPDVVELDCLVDDLGTQAMDLVARHLRS